MQISNLKALAVDDNAMNLLVITTMLEKLDIKQYETVYFYQHYLFKEK